jgi:hypothetical protein
LCLNAFQHAANSGRIVKTRYIRTVLRQRFQAINPREDSPAL